MLARILLILLLAAGFASAAPVQFESSSLKYLFSITFERKKDKISGVFTRSEYGVNPVRYRFTGTVVPGPGRESKIYVTYDKRDLKRKGERYPPTYQDAPWRFVQSRQGGHFYITVVSPIRSSSAQSWKVSQLEFDPVKPKTRR